MRIIGGKNKGKKLLSFNGDSIRPTSDRAREAIFNILQFQIKDCLFYDAFGGAGGMGLEALSRGAKVVFTDNNRESINLIKKNLSLINATAEVYLEDALSFLTRTDKLFDVIFLDPPYASDFGESALKIVSKRKLLTTQGLVIFEHERCDNRVIEGLNLIYSKFYGIAQFDFYKVVE